MFVVDVMQLNLWVQCNISGIIVEVLLGNVGLVVEILCGWLIDVSVVMFFLECLWLDWSSLEEGFQCFFVEVSDDFEYWQVWGDGQIVCLIFNGECIDVSEVKFFGCQVCYLCLVWLVGVIVVDFYGVCL